MKRILAAALCLVILLAGCAVRDISDGSAQAAENLAAQMKERLEEQRAADRDPGEEEAQNTAEPLLIPAKAAEEEFEDPEEIQESQTEVSQAEPAQETDGPAPEEEPTAETAAGTDPDPEPESAGSTKSGPSEITEPEPAPEPVDETDETVDTPSSAAQPDPMPVSRETAPSAPDPASEPDPVPEPEPEPVSQDVTYVLNSNPDRMRFHKPSCRYVDDIKPENRKDFYGTRDEVVAMGYVPCGKCKP